MNVTKKDIDTIIFDQLELLQDLLDARNGKNDLTDLRVAYQYASESMDVNFPRIYPLRISKPLDYKYSGTHKRTVEMLSRFCLEYEPKHENICAGEGK